LPTGSRNFPASEGTTCRTFLCSGLLPLTIRPPKNQRSAIV
jgi:hypothetical protein